MFSLGQKILLAILCCAAGVALFHLIGSEPSDGFRSELLTYTGSTSPRDDKPGFALIELFTSEGCSSCPSADKNLQRITAAATKNGTNVYTLSYHVDYWNRLGWEDPYSRRKFTQRQYDYARRFGSDGVYTPQMIVNGNNEFVGSNQARSGAALRVALAKQTTALIKLNAIYTTADKQKIAVDWSGQGFRGGTVNVVLVQKQGTQNVRRGENANRKLSHVNIVRDLKVNQRAENEGQVSFDVPQEFQTRNYHVVAFAETERGIVAANLAPIKTPEQIQLERQQQQQSQSGASQPGALNGRIDRRVQPVAYQSSSAPAQLVDAGQFLSMVSSGRNVAANLKTIGDNWNVAYVPMLLEVSRFMRGASRLDVIELLENKTGQSFGVNMDAWLQWNWKQQYTAHPQYVEFKSKLYSRIDPRFAEYFRDADNATIRLDEVRWGGVVRDGIPPLKDPQMIAANQANYLADTDVVFGIELNGDARCYPKRILAWHEMFKDTIGGESVCGVY